MTAFTSYAAMRAARVYRGCERLYGTGAACRVVWTGPMPADGAPLMIREGRYRRERQRACYELKFGRTRPSDRIVATCLNDRCVDYRHLRVIPAPKAPRASRARVNAPVIPSCHPSSSTAVEPVGPG